MKIYIEKPASKRRKCNNDNIGNFYGRYGEGRKKRVACSRGEVKRKKEK